MKHIKDISLFESEGSHINPAQTDMQADYDMLNKKMFDGELPRVPLRWMSTKNVVGLMSYDEDRKIRDVGISTYYKLNRQQYLDVLAHEMIHVWMEHKGIRERDPHGPKFLAKVKELNDRFPEFSIKKTENAADYEISGKVKIKEYGVVLFDEGEECGIVVVDPASIVDDEKVVNDFIEGIKKYALYRFKKLTLRIYKSSHPDLPKFKMKKSLSLKSLALYDIKKESADEIKKSTLVREEVLK